MQRSPRQQQQTAVSETCHPFAPSDYIPSSGVVHRQRGVGALSLPRSLFLCVQPC